MSNTPATVIAFVPGTTASELSFSLEGLRANAWPSILNKAFDPLRVPKAYALEHSTDAIVGDIVGSYPVPSGGNPDTACYADLVAFMQGTAFSGKTVGQPFQVYQCSDDPDPLPNAPGYLFYTVPYDWRIDNGASANTRLLTALNNLGKIYPDGNYNLYLVAHSNGGLVSRYLLEHVQPTGAGWWPKLRGLVTLATPHLGSALAWVPITNQKLFGAETELEVGFVTTVVDNSKFPSTFELVPPESMVFIRDGANAAVDIYAAASQPDSRLFEDMANTCKVNIGNLFQAATFQQNLDLSKAPCPYYFYYGENLPTLSISGDTAAAVAFTYTPGAATSEAVFTAQAAADLANLGDRVVPAISAMGGDKLPSGVNTKGYDGYNHGYMGGCDMTGYPQSIFDMLKVCGIATASASSKAAE